MRDNKALSSSGNEYLDVFVDYKLVRLCMDCYHALGWKTINTNPGITSARLRFVREKAIKNRTELCKLQRVCEDALIELEGLERIKIRIRLGIASIIHYKLAGENENKINQEKNLYYDVIYRACKEAQKLIGS